MKKAVFFSVLIAVVFLFSCFATFAAKQNSTYLTVLKSDPVNKQQTVSIKKTLTVKFNAKIYKGKKYSKIILTKSDKKPVAISFSINSNVLTVKAKSSLAYYTKYYLTVPVDSIKGIKGNSIKNNYVVQFTTEKKAAPKPTPTVGPTPTPTTPPTWKLKYDETFDTPLQQPTAWTEDKYGSTSPYHVDVVDEDGDFFLQNTGFSSKLSAFKSLRKSFTYGQDGWLTVEEYSRDSDKDGTPDSGGNVSIQDGVGVLNSPLNTDGVIIRSTNPLPSQYRIEVTISNINFGGQEKGSWTYNGKTNGYTRDADAGPWSGGSSLAENGMHFLGITDCKPAPHDNVFWYTHRKVFMETDNNNPSWSYVWDPVSKAPVLDGSHPVMMLWSNGPSFSGYGAPLSAMAYNPNGFMLDGPSVDKYLDGESYVFTIERDGDSYTQSVSGKFYYGGQTTYTATRKFVESDGTAIWHYNNTSAQYKAPYYNKKVTVNGKSFNSWPQGSAYPDYFYFGDPHINYYAGSAKFDNVKLYVYE